MFVLNYFLHISVSADIDDDELDSLISDADSTVSSTSFPVQSAQQCKRQPESDEM